MYISNFSKQYHINVFALVGSDDPTRINWNLLNSINIATPILNLDVNN